MQRSYNLMLFALVGLSLLLTAWVTFDYFDRRNRLQDAALEAAQTQSAASATEISEAFAELMTIAETLAAELGDGTLAYTDIEARMLNVVRARPDVDGLAITFAPFAYAPEVELFQVYVYQTADGSFDVLRGATYDYTATSSEIDTSWYVDTVNEGAQWHEPFFATGAQKILVEYGIPFYPVGESAATAEPAGIVSIDYTLADVRDLMRALELGATSYGFVLSGEGTFLSHPVAEFVATEDIFHLAGEDTPLGQAARRAIESAERDFVPTDDPITGEPVWYFFEPIAATGWTIGIVMNRAQFEPDQRQTVREQMNIALAAAGSLFLVAATIFHVDRFQFTNFWAVSGVFSLLCVVLIVLTWTLTNRLGTENGVTITDQSQLERYIEGLDGPAGSFSRPLEIPTGLLIQAIQFPDPTSVTINGYLWQRYPVDADIVQGFALPQRIGEEATIEEVQRETRNGEERIVWYIGVTLRQTYDTTRFPFDHRDINLRITPAELGAPVILTPDLAAYDLLTPSLLPGVDAGVDVNNWNLESSHFSYATTATNPTLLVVDNPENGHSLPELRFVIQAQRVYLGPFIAYLLPGLIAAAMTFAYLVSGRKVGDNDEIVGALNYAAALFFVVAVIHTALRDQIAAVGISYMEHVYILLYLAIVAVAANIFVVARFPQWGIVRYRDNLAPKVLYWPVFAGVLLLATLVIFVYGA